MNEDGGDGMKEGMYRRGYRVGGKTWLVVYKSGKREEMYADSKEKVFLRVEEMRREEGGVVKLAVWNSRGSYWMWVEI